MGEKLMSTGPLSAKAAFVEKELSSTRVKKLNTAGKKASADRQQQIAIIAAEQSIREFQREAAKREAEQQRGWLRRMFGA
jgi:hypothetical protein